MAAFKEDEFCLGTRGRCDLVGSIDALVGSIYVVQHSRAGTYSSSTKKYQIFSHYNQHRNKQQTQRIRIIAHSWYKFQQIWRHAHYMHLSYGFLYLYAMVGIILWNHHTKPSNSNLNHHSRSQYSNKTMVKYAKALEVWHVSTVSFYLRREHSRKNM